MKISSLQTIRPDFQRNLCVVVLTTDDGLTGLGEAFFHAATVETYLHESVAPALFSLADPGPERVASLLTPYVGFQGGGAELRGNGAIDLALWDIAGKRAGLPVVDLLGGAVRDSIPTYNTCAGSGYVGTTSRQESANWGIGRADRYEDLHAFLNRPAELAVELLAEGITGMKIWPFDEVAEQTRGTNLNRAALAPGLRIVSAIRDAVGDRMDLMIELHGLWNRPGAEILLGELTPYRPYWVEDPIRPDAVDALAQLRAHTDLPIATGETAVGRRGFLPLLQRGAVDIATIDVQWTGGLTEARKVASLADTFGVPIAPHDCTGPITLAACTHLALSQPNALVQETTRSFLRTWYEDVATGLPAVKDGQLKLSDRPGLGVALAEGFRDRDDVQSRTSSAST